MISKQYKRLIEKQPIVKVIAKTENNTSNMAWLAGFAFAFTGFVFFFSNVLWRALTGG